MKPIEFAKRQRIEDELARGPVFMYIDARREGVIVPAHLRGQYAVPIMIGHGLRPPIEDLEIDERGIYGTLSFGGFGFYSCAFPWAAIFAIRTGAAGEVAAWIADVPPELELKPVEPAKPKRHLRSV